MMGRDYADKAWLLPYEEQLILKLYNRFEDCAMCLLGIFGFAVVIAQVGAWIGR